MTAAVLDTSALLAHLNRETGADVVEAWLDRGGSAISALSVQELTKRSRSAAARARTPT